METALLGKTTLTVALPAPMYWQTRHQHRRMAMGSAVMRIRTDLQRQPPVISMASILPAFSDTYTAAHETLLLERQRHPRRRQKGNLSEIHRRPSARHPVPAGNQGREGPGGDRSQ